MTLPLLVLSFASIVIGWPIIIRYFWTVPHEEHASLVVPALAFVAFAAGLGGALAIYKNKKEDPVHIPLLANKFYIDEIYAVIIASTQDAAAKGAAWFDRWIIDGLGVRGISAGTWGAGFLLRLFQLGNLQAYAFLFGAGVVALIFYILFL
jgi:NADH-quinone oxidoreductase subunit L